MDRDMVNCIHYLYQWGKLTTEQMYEPPDKKTLLWCGPDTVHPLEGRKILVKDTDGTVTLGAGVYDLVDMVESQLRSMPKPDYAFGYPISSAIRKHGEVRPAFLAISYAAEFEAVKQAVVKAAGAAGFKCEVTGDLAIPGPVMDQVWGGIRGGDVVVADITDNNPNVFYEMGLAHALGKEVIVISQNNDAPFDIRAFRRISYAAGNLTALQGDLEKAFRAVSPRYPHEGSEPRF